MYRCCSQQHRKPQRRCALAGAFPFPAHRVPVRVKVEEMSWDKMVPTVALWEHLKSCLARPQPLHVAMPLKDETTEPDGEPLWVPREDPLLQQDSGAGTLSRAEEELVKFLDPLEDQGEIPFIQGYSEREQCTHAYKPC
ncbi:hypothetical protein Y1Q_0011184 [Alligator mississippiensis]|uniref:Uncharacterized protein n=1 Tax=Alligator mississippiensis TaxID=8496 RepID=A0A151MRS6_ALLMI|nr:hypothetical protein Y1Q_0011184 [Alligator mississippiensis]